MAANNQKRSLTAREQIAAANLSQLWTEKKKSGRRLVQKDAAAEFGMTQGMISQYLKGKTALGVKATMEFAIFLDVRPADIDPEFEFSSLAPGDLPPESIEVTLGWLALSPNIQKTTRELILSARND